MMVTTSPSSDEIKEVRVSPRVIAGRHQRVSVGDLAGYFARTIPDVAAELARARVTPSGPPVAVYRQEVGNTFEVLAGYPVDRLPGGTALTRLRLPGGRAVQATHTGSYATLPGTYKRLGAWFTDRDRQPPELMWEEYAVGPDGWDETGCCTRVFYPLR
jgi:effector-binding domain-containing protein